MFYINKIFKSCDEEWLMRVLFREPMDGENRYAAPYSLSLPSRKPDTLKMKK